VEEKAGVPRNLRPLIDEGRVLFGSTILGPGVAHGRAARTLIGIYNREGIFTNRADDLEGLERALTGAFPRLDVETQGSFALFAAW
jgi:hypothetical protein